MGFGQEVALLFKLEADPSNAIKNMQRLESSVKSSVSNIVSSFPGGGFLAPFLNELTRGGSVAKKDLGAVAEGASGAGGALAGMVNPATIAVAGVVAVGSAAAVTGKALFDLTGQTADTEGHLFALSQKLNFTVESLSTLSVEAQLSGSNIDSISTSLGIFDKNVSKANDGNKQLSTSFKALHIDTSTNERALRDTFKALAAMEEGERQTAFAMQFFGKSGKDVLGVIKEMGGDVDATTKKLAAMGILISGDAAMAADRYGDQWKMLDLRFEAAKRTVGEELMPVFFQLSDALSENAGDMALVRDVTKTYITEVGLLKDAVLGAIPGLAEYLELRKQLGGDITGANVASDAIPAQGGIKSPQAVALPTPDLDEMSKTAFRLASEEAKRTEQGVTSDLKRQLTERHISIDQFTKGTIDAAKQRLDAEVAAIQKRREAIEQEKPKDEAERKRVFDEQLTLAQREQAAQDAFTDAKREAESRQRRDREQATREHEQNILNIQLKANSNQIERIRAEIQDGITARAAGYQVIEQLENDSYEKQKSFFEKQRGAAGHDAAMWQQYTDKLKDLETSRTKTVEEQGRRRIEARDKEAEDELNRQLANFKRDDEVKDAEDRRNIARVRAAIDARVTAEDEGERQIAKIQDEAADRRMDVDLARLRFQLKNLTSEPSRKKDIDELSPRDLVKQARTASDTVGANQKEIDTLEIIRDLLTQLKAAAIDRAAASEEASQRIVVAEEKEAEATRTRAQDIYDADKGLEQGQRGLNRSRYEMELERDLLSIKQRQAIIAALTQLDLADAEERHRQTNEQLDEEERSKLNHAANLQEWLAVEGQYNDKRLQEEQRYQDERKKIKRAGDAASERQDPTSGRSLFGDVYANTVEDTGSKLVGFGATAADVFHKASAAAGNMKSMFADAFGSAVSGIQDMTKQWILYGTAGPHALQKMTASILAGLATQAIGKALWEGAEALAEYAIGVSLAANPFTAALAPGHFAAAAAHTTAAIAYGALGGASALLGRAVAGSAFSDTGASAGGGSVAGNAFGSGTSNNDPRVITENRNQWQQPPIPPHPEATVHVVVHSSTDTGAIQNVVGAYIEHDSGRTQIVKAIPHEYYHRNNEHLNGMLQHAIER